MPADVSFLKPPQEDFRSGIKKKAEVSAAADLRINAFTDVNVNLAGGSIWGQISGINCDAGYDGGGRGKRQGQARCACTDVNVNLAGGSMWGCAATCRLEHLKSYKPIALAV
jgi:hypothetical protein